MAQQNIPIVYREQLNLVQLGINGNDVNFKNCTMESNAYICVKDTAAAAAGGKPKLKLVNVAQGSVQEFGMSADSAIMNPVSKIIAVRNGGKLKTFNLELQSPMKGYELTNGSIKFWKWLTPKVIGFVTDTACWLWSMDGDSQPRQIFERHASLNGAQIIDFQIASNNKWLLLTGIRKGSQGGVDGNMQLYSVAKRVSQPLQGHAGTFTDVKVNGESQARTLLCFVDKKPGPDLPNLRIMQVDKPDGLQGDFRLQPRQIPFPPQAQQGFDFPVSLVASPKHDMLYLVTKMGFLYMFFVHTGSLIYSHQITRDPMIVTTVDPRTGGMLGVTARQGQVLSITVNEQTIVNYASQNINEPGLALKLATTLGVGGAENLFKGEFERLMQAQNFQAAAKLAARTPGDTLRNMETIQRFQAIPTNPGQAAPVLQYFQALLELGKLNQVESIELVRPVLQQGRKQLLEKWLKEDKLECSESLGDLVMQHNDQKMALAIYLRANATSKVINCFLNVGEYDNIIKYAAKVGYQPDYVFMLQNIVRRNPKAAEEFAKRLVTHEAGPLVDANQVAEVFMQMNALQECTAFLLEALKPNLPTQAALQTRLLEINLIGGAPQVADAVLGSEMFSHYDRPKIAALCERAQLFQRALEHYTEIEDFKRVIVHTQQINHEFLVQWFANLSAENALECLKQLLSHNQAFNTQIVVKVAQQYHETIGTDQVIELLSDYNSWQGIYYFLGAIINASQDPNVHFKYIESAAKLGQIQEVERICRASNVYDAEKVKDFLIEADLQDPRPLIQVCDLHGYVEELTGYLYGKDLMRHIEVYVTQVSPDKTPKVIGKLLDVDCNEDFIRNLLNQVRAACPVDPLVDEVEQRNRLRLLQPFLEQRIAEGNTEPATHNAIGKLYIRLNKEPQQFLLHNQFYDSKVLGKFCEKLDPFLSFLAYKRAWGACDDELIEVTNSNGLFKDQARYLVERQDAELWARVLNSENEFRRQLIDEVVGTALPENENADALGVTVQAFMSESLSNELIELLEKIILQGKNDFAQNENLQNLLILTAMASEDNKGRVMEYIQRLDNFNGRAVAQIAKREDYQLYEEAFEIYKKFEHNVEAVEVLLDCLDDIPRAVGWAERVGEAEVWTKVGTAQTAKGMTKDGIASFIKAGDPSDFKNVIAQAQNDDCWSDLIDYLIMARENKLKEKLVDTELIFAYAKCDRLGELEEFVSSPNIANVESVGDRCYRQQMYQAGKLLFTSISNFAMLASCHIALQEYREAVEAARKANAIRTWKEVNKACLLAGEFRLAASAGLNIITNPDHLEDVIYLYERLGHFEQIMDLLEQGLGLEQVHTGIFTELGVLFTKYRTEKVMDHIRIFWSRMAVPKMLRACEAQHHWEAAAYLYKENEEFDNCVRTMIDHSPEAWENDVFMTVILKVRNTDLHYSAISFYLEEQPGQLGRLLTLLTPHLHHSRVVHQARKSGHAPMFAAYFKSVQKEDIKEVNEVLNEMYIEEEDFASLRESIDSYSNFDQLTLAQKIEKHNLLEFRRIAAYVYKMNGRFEQSVRSISTPSALAFCFALARLA